MNAILGTVYPDRLELAEFSKTVASFTAKKDEIDKEARWHTDGSEE